MRHQHGVPVRPGHEDVEAAPTGDKAPRIRFALKRNYVVVSPSAGLAAFRLIKPSVLEPFLRAIMDGPLSFEAAFGNCRSRSHASPVVISDRNGIPRKSMENDSIVLQHTNILS